VDKTHARHMLFGIAGLLLLSMSCSPCGWLSESHTDWPSRPIEITEDAAQSLADKLEGSWDSQGNGGFLLQITDQELTSYLNLRLLDSSDLPLQDPHIWFTRGNIYASGQLSIDQLPFDTNATIVSGVGIVNGTLQLSIEQASFGQIPIPNGLVSSLESRVNGALAQAQAGLQIIELEILETEILLVAATR